MKTNTLRLIRQHHIHPDFTVLKSMRQSLETLIHSDFDVKSDAMEGIIKEIIQFQNQDGSFSLLDSYQVESDARIDFCHEPTYICTAILMKALLENKAVFNGKEDCIFPKALNMCSARGLRGHGFGELGGLVNAVNYFMRGGVKDFLNAYPEMCPKFTDMFRNISKHFILSVREQAFTGDWGESYETSIRKIAAYFSASNVFVYGTLLNGQANHDAYLQGKECLGAGHISGYDMYELGCYPGIVAGNGTVCGEVYSLDETARNAIDRLEGEGSLYIRTPVKVAMENGSTLFADVYVYNRSVAGRRKLSGKYGQREDNPYVWYVSYGSNLLSDRLKSYIQGGYCFYNGHTYSPCSDTALPADSRTLTIPYDMYYSNYDMGSWNKSAVSFLDLSKPGKAYGRAYKIRKSQLDEIHQKEGAGSNWYPDCVRLADIDGLPAYTYANRTVKTKEPFYRVSAEYGIVLANGMKEAYPALTDEDILVYLKHCGK